MAETNNETWIKEGATVGLNMIGRLVAKGKVISTNAKDICHHVELGKDRVQIIVEEVFDFNVDYAFEEPLRDMIGSYLVWNKVDLLDLSKRLRTDNENRNEGGGTEVQMDDNNSRTEDTMSSGGARLDHIRISGGMEVKVLDIETRLVFGVGTVHVINPSVRIGQTVLGKTHVGILIHGFGENANLEHVKLKDTLIAWSMDRLLASDGRLLSFHFLQQSLFAKDASSRKRSYTTISRKRKEPPQTVRKKDIALTVDSVRLISTMDCCSQKCCQYIHRDVAMKVRKNYWSKSYTEKKEMEINAIVNALDFVDGEKVVVVEGMGICLEAWRILHSRGKTQFYELKKMVKAGVKVSSHGNLGKRRMTEAVSQAFCSMGNIINEVADHHPAKQRTMADNSRQVLRELPTSYSWEFLRNKVNQINDELGLPPISQSTMSLLHQKFFKEVAIHKKGNNFSKCTLCVELKERKSHLSGNVEELEAFKREENAHHQEHTEGRLLYHAWRTDSVNRPKEVLCIIHDKMDHCKTAIPSLPHSPKGVDGAFKLPVTVTGILTHGHGPRAIAQYNVAVWPSDPNMTIGSLDSILRMLENPAPMMSSLLEGDGSTQLFKKLMEGGHDLLDEDVRRIFKEDTDYLSSIDTSSSSSNPQHRPLSRKLRLQLDNCAGDNKNRFVMAYLSLLTARGVFEEIQTGFLIPGHTHEDVDAMFGHFSGLLTRLPIFTLPDMMRLLMRCRKPNPVPHLVQEVPDFKSYVEPFMLKGGDAMVGHGKPRLFRFYVREDGMPCVQYKIKSMDTGWLPEEGIEMWYWKEDGHPNLPEGSPKRLPMSDIKALDMVIDGLKKHTSFLKTVHRNMHESGKSAYKKCVDYWVDILRILETEQVNYRIEDGDDLVHGFWPISRWTYHVGAHFKDPACELESPTNYVGPRRYRPRETFNPRLDIVKGCFILQRPANEDLSTYPVHLGLVVSDGVKEDGLNDDNMLEHKCDVKWYRPHMQKRRSQVGDYSTKDRWANCWGKKWERDQTYPNACRISVSSIMWCFMPRKSKHGQTGLITIPKNHAKNAQDNLRRCLRADGIEEVEGVFL